MISGVVAITPERVDHGNRREILRAWLSNCILIAKNGPNRTFGPIRQLRLDE